jgi:hypothetical protein
LNPPGREKLPRLFDIELVGGTNSLTYGYGFIYCLTIGGGGGGGIITGVAFF